MRKFCPKKLLVALLNLGHRRCPKFPCLVQVSSRSSVCVDRRAPIEAAVRRFACSVGRKQRKIVDKLRRFSNIFQKLLPALFREVSLFPELKAGDPVVQVSRATLETTVGKELTIIWGFVRWLVRFAPDLSLVRCLGFQ